jgi:hypothetical protein
MQDRPVHFDGEIVGLLVDGLVHRVEHVRHLLPDPVQFRIDLILHQRHRGFVVVTERCGSNLARRRDYLAKLRCNIFDRCRLQMGFAQSIGDGPLKFNSDLVELGICPALRRWISLSHLLVEKEIEPVAQRPRGRQTPHALDVLVNDHGIPLICTEHIEGRMAHGHQHHRAQGDERGQQLVPDFQIG